MRVKRIKHGYYKHQYYYRWVAINDRCRNVNSRYFANYGGRGIAVFPEWCSAAGPKAFCDWIDEHLGACPEGMTLDREDNSKGYEPGNVRWASRQQQTENRRIYKKAPFLPAGVRTSRNGFRVDIWLSGKQVFLGRFGTPEEAVEILQFAKRQLTLYRSELQQGDEGR